MTFKIVLLGFSSGKTTLCKSLTNNPFYDLIYNKTKYVSERELCDDKGNNFIMIDTPNYEDINQYKGELNKYIVESNLALYLISAGTTKLDIELEHFNTIKTILNNDTANNCRIHNIAVMITKCDQPCSNKTTKSSIMSIIDNIYSNKEKEKSTVVDTKNPTLENILKAFKDEDIILYNAFGKIYHNDKVSKYTRDMFYYKGINDLNTTFDISVYYKDYEKNQECAYYDRFKSTVNTSKYHPSHWSVLNVETQNNFFKNYCNNTDTEGIYMQFIANNYKKNVHNIPGVDIDTVLFNHYINNTNSVLLSRYKNNKNKLFYDLLFNHTEVNIVNNGKKLSDDNFREFTVNCFKKYNDMFKILYDDFDKNVKLWYANHNYEQFERLLNIVNDYVASNISKNTNMDLSKNEEHEKFFVTYYCDNDNCHRTCNKKKHMCEFCTKGGRVEAHDYFCKCKSCVCTCASINCKCNNSDGRMDCIMSDINNNLVAYSKLFTYIEKYDFYITYIYLYLDENSKTRSFIDNSTTSTSTLKTHSLSVNTRNALLIPCGLCGKSLKTTSTSVKKLSNIYKKYDKVGDLFNENSYVNIKHHELYRNKTVCIDNKKLDSYFSYMEKLTSSTMYILLNKMQLMRYFFIGDNNFTIDGKNNCCDFSRFCHQGTNNHNRVIMLDDRYRKITGLFLQNLISYSRPLTVEEFAVPCFDNLLLHRNLLT